MKQFSDKEWLEINIANLFGLDKLLWEERLDWVNTHITSLEDFSEKADKPYQYAAAVYNYRKAVKGEAIGTLVGLDAHASGITIMGILEGCMKTGTQTNLIDPTTRYDLYSSVAKEFGMARKDIKPSIMTTFYSSVAAPMKILGDRYPEFISVIRDLLPGAWDVKESLENFHRTDVDHVSWVLPDGHTAYIKYFTTEEKRVELTKFGSFTYATKVQQPTDNYRSLSPNIIHSIDSWIVREMVRRCNFEMLPIHDSFFTAPANVNAMRQHYVDILVKLSLFSFTEMFESICNREVQWVKASNEFPYYLKEAEYALS